MTKQSLREKEDDYEENDEENDEEDDEEMMRSMMRILACRPLCISAVAACCLLLGQVVEAGVLNYYGAI